MRHSKFAFVTRAWFRLFAGGLVLFLGTEQALKLTGNPNLVPTVILLGALVVPVSLVTYFYQQERLLDREAPHRSPAAAALWCFLAGGAVGVTVAGVLEYETLRNSAISSLFVVGLIEESAKLIFPVAIYLRRRYISEIDGLLFGVAAGMGFAAFETMGYGLNALLSSGGTIGAAEEVLLVRGFLSPAGHAAWTALVCAVLWRERQRTGRMFNLNAVWAFALAVVLHASWDIISGVNQPFIIYIGYLIVGGLSLTLLILRLREARRLKLAVGYAVADS